MMNGTDCIVEERAEQINKHGFDSSHDDDELRSHGELAAAAMYLLSKLSTNRALIVCAGYPLDWDPKYKLKFDAKSDLEKLVTAGALIAAEYDRIVRGLRIEL